MSNGQRQNSRVTDTCNNSVCWFLPAGLAAKRTRRNITVRQYLAILFPPSRGPFAASLTRKKKVRSNIELTHRVKAANEEYGVRFVPPAWILLRVQRVHCPKPRPRKSSCAIRNKGDKILDLFPDGAGDRLTFQSVEIRRLDFQRFCPADWLGSPIDFRDCSELRCHWSKSLT